MEEQFYVDRTYLRQLLIRHPNWTTQQYAEATGRSYGWVKKWRKRLREARIDDENVLHGLSRARKSPPTPIHADVVKRVLEIRDHPPENLHRIPEPRTILYYLQRDEEIQTSGHPV